jgi:hypothetical protein
MDFVRYSISRFLGSPGRIRSHFGTLLLRGCLVFVLFFTLNVQAASSQAGSSQSPAAPMPVDANAISVTPTLSADPTITAATVFTLTTVDGPPYFVNMTSRALSFQAGNQPCAAYGGDGLYYTCYITPTWQTRTVVDNSVGVGEYASLSQRNIPYLGRSRSAISYYDALNGKLKLAYKDDCAVCSGIWSKFEVPAPIPPYSPERAAEQPTQPSFSEELEMMQHPGLSQLKQLDPKLVFAPVGVGKYSSVKVDAFGGYHISYYDEYDHSLNYAYWDGSGDGTNPNNWLFELVPDPEYGDIGKGIGLWSSIQVDSNFNVHIAYMSEKYDHLKYAFKNAGTSEWTVETVDGGGSGGAHVGSMCSLALDSSNVPYISYLDFSNGNLKAAKLVNLNANQWTIDKVDTSDYSGWWTSITVDGSGQVHISYYNADRGDLKYAIGKLGKTWTRSTLQNTPGNVGWFTSIAINPTTGKPAILYYNPANGALMYIPKLSTNRWATPQVVDSNGSDVGLASSLKLGSDGTPYISYMNASAGFLKYARAFGPNWVFMYPYTQYLYRRSYYITFNGLSSSIQLDPSGRPRIAFYDVDKMDLMYALWNGTSFNIMTTDWPNDVGQFVSLKVDSGGSSHISYYDVTNQDLKYAFGYTDPASTVFATTWYTYTLDSFGDVGLFTSITQNPATNRLFISYYDKTNGDLKLSYQTSGGVWKSETVDEGGALLEDVGMYTSISLDSVGNPYITYYDYTNGRLKFAFWQGGGFPSTGSWNISTVPQDPLDGVNDDVGRFSSLKVDPSDNSSHMCYFNNTKKTLKYAHYTGIWEFATVDNTSDAGWFCSLDLLNSTKIAISYYDLGKKDLKLALSYNLLPISGNEIYMPVIRK